MDGRGYAVNGCHYSTRVWCTPQIRHPSLSFLSLVEFLKSTTRPLTCSEQTPPSSPGSCVLSAVWKKAWDRGAEPVFPRPRLTSDRTLSTHSIFDQNRTTEQFPPRNKNSYVVNNLFISSSLWPSWVSSTLYLQNGLWEGLVKWAEFVLHSPLVTGSIVAASCSSFACSFARYLSLMASRGALSFFRTRSNSSYMSVSKIPTTFLNIYIAI